jgi:hypothetical protein
MTAKHELWLTNDVGSRIALLDDVEDFGWNRVVNNMGRASVYLPGDFDRSLLRRDYRIEIWRSPTSEGDLRLENVFFIRRPVTSTAVNGTQRVQVNAVDPNELLSRRIVAYAAGSSESSKTDEIDDMIKAIVRENLGALAGNDSFGASRSFDASFFGVQADAGSGPSITKSFAWRNVLDILQDLSDISREVGVEIYYAIIPTSTTTFEFRTYTDQPGQDRRVSVGGNPTIFSLERGNLETPILEDDYEDEMNYVYGGGQGEGVARDIQEVRDLTRINASAWNRREAFRDARHEATSAGVEDEADALLVEGRPKRRFSAFLLSRENARYGLDWDLGDRITVEYLGEQFDGLIKVVSANVDPEGLETIEGKVEVEDVT